MDFTINPFEVNNTEKPIDSLKQYNLYYQNLPKFMESLNVVESTATSSKSLSFEIDAGIQQLPCSSTSVINFNDDDSDQSSKSDDDDDQNIVEHHQQQGNIISQHKFNRRVLPTRRSKENFFESNNRRVKMKPKKFKKELNLKEIKKLYLQKNYKFKTSNLETIYEEPLNTNKGEIRFIGTKKLRRSISLSDGLNINKTTTKSRRERIKKFFGRKRNNRHPKLTLDDLIIKLNNSIENDSNTKNNDKMMDTNMNSD